jgi:hypothetical protein
MSKKPIPYVYLIGWTSLNVWYYGSKTGKNAFPELFWKNYFTSSGEVKRIRLEHGDPDVIKVRKTFKTNESALSWERKVIRRIGAVYSDKWLNKTEGGMLKFVKAYTKSGKSIVVSPDDFRFQSGEIFHYNKGYSLYVNGNGDVIRCSSEEARKLGYTGHTKNKQAGKNNPFFGKKHTKESKRKIGKKSKGRKPNLGKKWSDAEKENLKTALKNRNFYGENNPSYGSYWMVSPNKEMKCYVSVKNGDLYNKLINKGWIKYKNGMGGYNKMKSVTKTIKDHL